MKSCYLCGKQLNTKHKSRVKCVCGATYRVLRNVKIINPKTLSALEKAEIVAHKAGDHKRKKDFDCPICRSKKNPITTLGLGIAGGLGFGAGYIAAEKILKKK